MGQFLPVRRGPRRRSANDAVAQADEPGALVIGGGEHPVVWRGVAQAKINFDTDFKKREAIVREAVHDLLRRFPPKPQ